MAAVASSGTHSSISISARSASSTVPIAGASSCSKQVDRLQVTEHPASGLASSAGLHSPRLALPARAILRFMAAPVMKDTAQASGRAARRHLYLIDGSGFLFRAFHALPPLTRGDGTPINAVLGFSTMLMKLLNETDADHIAVIF